MLRADLRVPQELKDPLERKVAKVLHHQSPDHREQPELKAQQVLLGRRVLKVPQEQLATRAVRVLLGLLVHKVAKELRVLQATPAHKAQPETRDPKEILVLKVHKERVQVWLVRKVQLVPREVREQRGLKEILGQRVLKGRLALKGTQALQVLKELRERRARQEQPEAKAPQARKVVRVLLQVSQDPKETQEPPDRKEVKE